MDFSMEFPPLYYNTENKKISELEIRINTENNKLNKKISELETQINTENIKCNNLNEHINKIITRINTYNDRLNRHRAYFDILLKNIQDVSNMQIAQNNKINDIITKYNIIKDIINIKDDELIKIKNKQIEQEIQIIENQKQHAYEILELREMIRKQKNPEETNINVPITNKNKRPFNNITEDYIEQLKLTKKRSNKWSIGMSKYISITLVNDRWRWETPIFGQKHINFKTKEEAEKHYENIIAKYNIDPIHITRQGYDG